MYRFSKGPFELKRPGIETEITLFRGNHRLGISPLTVLIWVDNKTVLENLCENPDSPA